MGYGTATADTLDTISNNPDVDIIYVVTPTLRHREFAVCAAALDKHTI
jgi:predicted dehydrogenase